MSWIEDAILNRICPKSLVLYARKAVSRPLRILFTAYRGNMRCGGQGI